MSATTIAAESGLIFRWEPPRRRLRAFLACLVGSVLLHAFGFYLFQIVYPPTVTLLPAPARVSVLSPAVEEGRLLLRWLEAEDPAITLATQRPRGAPAAALPRVEHFPSFSQYRPALKQLPPYSAPIAVDPNPPAPVPSPPPSSAAPLPVSPTRLSFGDEVASRGAPHMPPLHFTRSRSDTPEAARFRIAISSAGDVRYCFLTASSRDASLDEQARQALALCRFGSDDSMPLTWTTATIDWGNDTGVPEAPPAARSP